MVITEYGEFDGEVGGGGGGGGKPSVRAPRILVGGWGDPTGDGAPPASVVKDHLVVPGVAQSGDQQRFNGPASVSGAATERAKPFCIGGGEGRPLLGWTQVEVEKTGPHQNSGVTGAPAVRESMRYPVHWVAHSASPYNAHLFKALAADPAIDLTVHFMHGVPADRPWQGQMTD